MAYISFIVVNVVLHSTVLFQNNRDNKKTTKTTFSAAVGNLLVKFFDERSVAPWVRPERGYCD